MRCIALPRPPSVLFSDVLSLLLHYGALLKFLSGLNSFPSSFSCSFSSARLAFSLLSASGRSFLHLRRFDHPRPVRETVSLSCMNPADVQFAHSHQHSFFSPPVSYGDPLTRAYSLDRFKHEWLETGSSKCGFSNVDHSVRICLPI